MYHCKMGLLLMVCILYLSDFSFTKDINMFKILITSQGNKPKTPMEDTDISKIPMEDTDMPKTPMQDTDKPMTPMEALDKVQEIYATNFDKVPFEEGAEEYYYKLNQAEYYLVYEGIGGDKCYLFHLYEFVLDEPETGLGHTVTYGWYSVAIRTGEVISEVEQ